MTGNTDGIDWSAIVTQVVARYPRFIRCRDSDHICEDETRYVVHLDGCELAIPGVPVDALGKNPDDKEVVAVERRLLELAGGCQTK